MSFPSQGVGGAGLTPESLSATLVDPEFWLADILTAESLSFADLTEITFSSTGLDLTGSTQNGTAGTEYNQNRLYHQLASGDNEIRYPIPSGTDHMRFLFACDGMFSATASEFRFEVSDNASLTHTGTPNIGDTVAVVYTRNATPKVRLDKWNAGAPTFGPEPANDEQLLPTQENNAEPNAWGIAIYMEVDGANGEVIRWSCYQKIFDAWFPMPYAFEDNITTNVPTMGALAVVNLWRNISSGTETFAMRAPIGIWTQAV